MEELWVVLPDVEQDSLSLVSKAAQLAQEQALICHVWLIGIAKLPGWAEGVLGAGGENITYLPIPPRDGGW